MKPLTLEETALKEEMKERCLAKGQYTDENAKAKFEMLCHLEDFEVQYWKLQQENKILKENAEHNDKVVDKVNWGNYLLKKENQKLKNQLDYLRSGEYYNQLRFENKMLQDIVDNGEVLKEDREFIDCTHRNTELLEQQEEFINYMMNTIENITQDETDDEEIKGYLIQRGNTFKEILSKYKSIIGGKDEDNKQ